MDLKFNYPNFEKTHKVVFLVRKMINQLILKVHVIDIFRFELLSMSGCQKGTLIYKDEDYNAAQIQGDETFRIQQLSNDNWITVFKNPIIEKLIVSIKSENQRSFIIKNIYTRTKYCLKVQRNTNHFVLKNEEDQILLEIKTNLTPNLNKNLFEVIINPAHCNENHWFLILHALYCAIYCLRQIDPMFIVSFIGGNP